MVIIGSVAFELPFIIGLKRYLPENAGVKVSVVKKILVNM